MDAKKIKKDNLKALPKYLLIMLVAGIFGGVLGFLIGYVENETDIVDAVTALLHGVLRAISFWSIPVTSVLVLGAAAWLYLRAKRLFNEWDGEDETTMDLAEYLLGWALLLDSTQMILDMFFFAVLTRYMEGWPVLVGVGMFFLSVAAIVFQQQRIVDLTRRMNPEKQGSVYDTKFKQKWLDSCDEAERRQIGQAAFQSYKVTSVVYPIVWCALLLLDLTFDFGLMPVFVVTLLWAIQNGTYCIAANSIIKKHLT